MKSLLLIAFLATFATPTNAEEITVVISNDYVTCLEIATGEGKEKTCSLYDISNKKEAKEVLTVASRTFARSFLELESTKPICFDAIGFFNCNGMKRNLKGGK
jgi:hypothetical protein